MSTFGGNKPPEEWQQPRQNTEGYRPYRTAAMGTGTQRSPQKPKRPRRQTRRGKTQQASFWASTKRLRLRGVLRRAALVLLILLIAAAGFSFGVVFRVRHLYADGMSSFTEAQVTALSGIRIGASILSVDENKVAENINRETRLVFVGLEKTWNSVSITVRERVPAAVVKHSGIYYLVDRSGMVLDESQEEGHFSGLPEVSGIGLAGRNSTRVGAFLNVSSQRQLEVLSELLLEIKVHSAERIIASIKLSNMEDILMETVDGFSVRMGDTTHIRGKIKALLLVREELLNRNSGSGTIDVSTYTEPTFISET